MKRRNGKRYCLLLFASSKVYASLDRIIAIDAITDAPGMTLRFIEEFDLKRTDHEGGQSLFEAAQVYDFELEKIIGEVGFDGTYVGKAWAA